VVFVRHALPGEVVRARLTEAGEHDSFWRADAVEVLKPSPDRVPARCPVAGPGGCGGCDWQHATPAAGRALKADVVREQLHRLAGLADVPGLGAQVEAVPGDDDGLGWRTRVRFTVGADGRPGLLRHRSHDVVPVDACPIAHAGVNALGVPTARWPGAEAVEVVATTAGERLAVVVQPEGPAAAGRARVPELPAGTSVAVTGPDGLQRLRGRTWVSETVTVAGRDRPFRVTGAGFWQVHPGAAQALLDAVLDAAAPRPGERALDLYSGVGLFAAGLAAAVGEAGEVIAVESDRRAVADARRGLHDLPQVRLVADRVDRALAGPDLPGTADVVVLDPPRAGAGRRVVEQVLARRPRAVVYVACDPASLARDVGTAGRHGYRLRALRAFDLFPMTHHVECVATLVP
jgi:tRNA/tmRNA/rRNA uracil-C5-methylase (TrmA/RlmC/RlmD family)